MHDKSLQFVSDSWLLCPWNSPGKNARVSCHAFLQGIFPNQGLNPHLLQLCICRFFVVVVVCLITSPTGCKETHIREEKLDIFGKCLEICLKKDMKTK